MKIEISESELALITTALTAHMRAIDAGSSAEWQRGNKEVAEALNKAANTCDELRRQLNNGRRTV